MNIYDFRVALPDQLTGIESLMLADSLSLMNSTVPFQFYHEDQAISISPASHTPSTPSSNPSVMDDSSCLPTPYSEILTTGLSVRPQAKANPSPLPDPAVSQAALSPTISSSVQLILSSTSKSTRKSILQSVA